MLLHPNRPEGGEVFSPGMTSIIPRIGSKVNSCLQVAFTVSTESPHLFDVGKVTIKLGV